MIGQAKLAFDSRLEALLRLSRWREHIPFTLPATLLGINMALRASADERIPDTRLLALLAANILAVTFAFMVNDIEDAADDARDAARAARNAVAAGAISPRVGWLAAGLVALLAAALYAPLGPRAMITGGLVLVLGWLYSWRPVRLKAWPVVDVLSHALMLSALLFLAGYLAYAAAPGRAWWAVAGVGLISAHGQLYNQLRDFEMDRAAGLRNSGSVLGPGGTRRLMIACLAAGGLCLGVTVWAGLWPGWLLAGMVLCAPVVLVFRSQTDMRGAAALDLSGQMQWGFMLAATVALVIWLIAQALVK